MYSRIAGTGVLSASLGIHSRAANRRPSDMGIHCSSTSRNLPSTLRRIAVIGLPASGTGAFLPLTAPAFCVRHGTFAYALCAMEPVGAVRVKSLHLEANNRGVGPAFAKRQA